MDLDSLPSPEILRQFVIMAMSGVKAALKVQRTAGSLTTVGNITTVLKSQRITFTCIPLKVTAHVTREDCHCTTLDWTKVASN